MHNKNRTIPVHHPKCYQIDHISTSLHETDVFTKMLVTAGFAEEREISAFLRIRKLQSGQKLQQMSPTQFTNLPTFSRK